MFESPVQISSMKLSLTIIACLSACTNGPIPHTDSGVEGPHVSAGFRITGTFCPRQDLPRQPVRVMFLVDTSQSMAVNDPVDSSTGKSGRRKALEDVFSRFANNNLVTFAVISFDHVERVLTRTAAGQDGFTRDPKALNAALARVDQTGGLSDFEGAVAAAHQVLSADMGRLRAADPHALQHSSYIVILLADGAPYPRIETLADWAGVPASVQKEMTGAAPSSLPVPYNTPARILSKVSALTKLPVVNGAASIRIYPAYLRGSHAASSAATDLLKGIASLGGGFFRSFATAEQIDFHGINYSSPDAAWPRLKNFVVSNMNLRPAGAGPGLDSDGDGLTDKEEKKLRTNLYAVDTDGDGRSDAVEHLFGGDPRSPKDGDCPLGKYDQDGDGRRDDSDGDGLLDCEELVIGSHARLPDSDADGFDDRQEVLGGTDPLTHDSARDTDFDGVSNGDELRGHTSPVTDEGAARGQAYRYAVKRHLTKWQECYSFSVDNVGLSGPSLGANTIMLYADQAQDKTAGDHGTFSAACVQAGTGQGPAAASVPQSAWKLIEDLRVPADCVTR